LTSSPQLDDLLHDMQHAAVEIHVDPAQPERLAASQTDERDQVVERESGDQPRTQTPRRRLRGAL